MILTGFHKFITELFTLNDNKTWSLTKVLTACGSFTFFGLQLVAILYDHQTWHPTDFGIGFASILGGIGVVHSLHKDVTEVPSDDSTS